MVLPKASRTNDLRRYTQFDETLKWNVGFKMRHQADTLLVNAQLLVTRTSERIDSRIVQLE